MDKPKEFSIEHQWKLYLKRAEVPEEKLGPVQRQEMRRAFFGSWGQALIVMRDELGDYADKNGDDAAANILQGMTGGAGAINSINDMVAKTGDVNKPVQPTLEAVNAANANTDPIQQNAVAYQDYQKNKALMALKKPYSSDLLTNLGYR